MLADYGTDGRILFSLRGSMEPYYSKVRLILTLNIMYIILECLIL
jgi:hypothetical protein